VICKILCGYVCLRLGIDVSPLSFQIGGTSKVEVKKDRVSDAWNY